jgi:hypothetical protein
MTNGGGGIMTGRREEGIGVKLRKEDKGISD